MISDSDTFCIMPFIHLEARSDSLVAPCCMSQEFYRKDDGTFFTLSKDTLADVWNSKSIADLRNELTSGKKASACSVCWKEEELGKESKRIRENNRWGTDPNPSLRFLDLKLGNTCNLKCRICSPGSSSSWIKEHQDVYGWDIVSYIAHTVGEDRVAVMQWPEHNDKFWEDLDSKLADVELFEIYGGEPFLIQRHFEVLRKSIELGYSKNQRIHYNTNGTVYPEKEILNIWPHFKEVDIMFSIDGIGEQFEYQRFPAKWDSVLNNMLKFKENFAGTTGVCLSVSSLNVYYLPEYLEFFRDFGLSVWMNIVYQPDVYAICNLNSYTKDRVEAKLAAHVSSYPELQSIINFMKSSTDDKQAELIEKIRVHDAYRKQDFFKTFRDYGDIIND